MATEEGDNFDQQLRRVSFIVNYFLFVKFQAFQELQAQIVESREKQKNAEITKAAMKQVSSFI